MRYYLAIFFLFLNLFFCFPADRVYAEEKTFVFYTGVQSPVKEILDRRLAEAFKRIGKKSKLVPTGSSQRALFMANKFGDGDASRVPDIKKIAPELTNNLLMVPEPVLNIIFYVYTKDKKILISGWNSLEKYHNGFRVGAKILEKNMPGKITKLPNTEQLLKMLDQNRLDTVTEHGVISDYIINKLNLQNINKLLPPLVSLPGYCFIHKKNRHLISDLAQALSDMKKDGSFKSIQNEVIKGK